MRVPTVTVNRDGTPVRINQSDFIEGEHELWDPDKPFPDSDKKPDPGEAVAVHKGGGKWIVEVEGEQIHEGYLSKAEAANLVADTRDD
jgi:hypothetical protein